jgi:hypothetical protein
MPFLKPNMIKVDEQRMENPKEEGRFKPLAEQREGEFDLRQALPLTPLQRAKLQQLVQTDPEAKVLWGTLKASADAVVNDAPKPRGAIVYQGKLDTDPERIESVESLKDMDKIALLSQAYAASGNAIYSDALKRFTLAWVKAYVPNGNSINENKLEPVFYAYDMTRDAFSTEEKQLAEKWLRKIANRQIETNGWRDREHSKKALDNWDAKRIKIVGGIGFVLGDEALIQYGIDHYKKYIELGLFPDGTSHDLKVRDALSYHQSGLKPMLVLAILADRKGVVLYPYEAASGSSLVKSIEYVRPYADGTKTREEWKNTTVGLDKERAHAGIDYYQPGKLFDPQSAAELFELASYFNPDYAPLVARLRAGKTTRFPSWQAVLNEAMKTKS